MQRTENILLATIRSVRQRRGTICGAGLQQRCGGVQGHRATATWKVHGSKTSCNDRPHATEPLPVGTFVHVFFQEHSHGARLLAAQAGQDSLLTTPIVSRGAVTHRSEQTCPCPDLTGFLAPSRDTSFAPLRLPSRQQLPDWLACFRPMVSSAL